MENSFFSENELKSIGFNYVGKNVKISKKASFYGVKNISIGDNVRIDDFSILSGTITIGNFVHIGAYTGLFGKNGIILKDFSGISIRSVVLSANDDFSGEYLTNSPVINEDYCHTMGSIVIFEKHVNVGTGSTVMPGVNLAEGSVIGSMSLVVKNTEPWTIYFGIPCRAIEKRKKDLLKVEKQFLQSIERK